MKLAKHIRRLTTVYGYKDTIITDTKLVRQLLFQYGITPSTGQVNGTIRKHIGFILFGPKPVQMVQGLDY